MILSTLKYQTIFPHPKSVILSSNEDTVLSTLTLCYSWYLVFLLHLTRTVQELIALRKTLFFGLQTQLRCIIFGTVLALELTTGWRDAISAMNLLLAQGKHTSPTSASRTALVLQCDWLPAECCWDMDLYLSFLSPWLAKGSSLFTDSRCIKWHY